MFRDASLFNQPIGSWDLSSCTTIGSMFYSARQFNQPVNSWNTSNVTDMSYTFNGSGGKHNFNQPLGNWNTSKVTNMREMFRDCQDFNHPLTTSGSSWDVSKVVNMNLMLYRCSSFDQDLSSWNIASVTDTVNMFQSSGMSKANLDATIQGWCGKASTPSGLNLGQIPLDGTTQTLDPATTTLVDRDWETY